MNTQTNNQSGGNTQNTQTVKSFCAKDRAVIAIVAVYLGLFVILDLQGLVGLWSLSGCDQKPEQTISANASADSLAIAEQPTDSTSTIDSTQIQVSLSNAHEKSLKKAPATLFFVVKVMLSGEMRMLLIVIFCGALGALIHSVRSFTLFVGNRTFCVSWMLHYFLRPFLGAMLGTLFYLIVRGGFFSPDAGVQVTSKFGLSALAALAGLFSDAALEKLKQISHTFFAPPEKAANPVMGEKKEGEEENETGETAAKKQ